jgi:FKBP-type peptidyl-prolyl cis-trans isomerase FkpA
MKTRLNVIVLALCCVFLASSCQKDLAEKDDETIQDFISDNQLEAIKDPSGVYIVIDEEGNNTKPNLLNYITIHYEGSYLDEEVFDSSLGSNPISSYLSNFIEGWKIGIPYFGEGGSGTLIIPSGLAYGSNPPGPIRKNAILKFYIELIKVE